MQLKEEEMEMAIGGGRNIWSGPKPSLLYLLRLSVFEINSKHIVGVNDERPPNPHYCTTTYVFTYIVSIACSRGLIARPPNYVCFTQQKSSDYSLNFFVITLSTLFKWCSSFPYSIDNMYKLALYCTHCC